MLWQRYIKRNVFVGFSELYRQDRVRLHIQFFSSLIFVSGVSIAWYLLVHYELLSNPVATDSVVYRNPVTALLNNMVPFGTIWGSGGASYGAKGLKPSADFAQAPIFMCKVMFLPVTTIIKCHHRRPTFNCELQKNVFGGRTRCGAYSAPQTPSWIERGMAY